MKNRYQHSKAAMMLFNLCAKGSKVLYKHKALYYLLMFTWGIIMTTIGLLASLVLIIGNVNPKRYKNVWYFSLGKYWGGVSLGCTFARDTTSSGTIEPHEYGHTFQNAILGPFFPFLVAIPSFIRYWYQEIRRNKGKTNKPYDSAWFEDSATTIGKYIKETDDAKNIPE